jgi:signal transduction histidine kinase
MLDFITTLVSSDGFIPHGHCYLWQPGVLWLHVISDSLIVLAYYSIPITLVYFVRKRKDLEFHWMFICFAVFILACGTTHLMEIWNVWHPTYWLSGSIKALTALASIPTAILLVKLVPTALALPSPSTLKAVNEQMEGEIVERKRIEQNLYEKNIELENANLAKDRFLANMSHELRTPLNAIIGFSELMKDGMAGELIKKQHDFITEIFNSGEHLLSLINDILDLSKVETGKMTLDLEAVEVAGLLQSSLNVIRGNAYKHNIKLKLDLPDDAGRLMMDARKVKQIVYNLLSNAVKFTQDGGEVRISTCAVPREDLRLPVPKGGAVRQLPLPNSEFEKFLEIKVCDSGIGIADADLPRLFQAFLQLDSSLARTSPGSGLGLALVSRLVDLHGGTVAVASAPGHGSCFTVWLPWRNMPLESLSGATETGDGQDLA